MKWLKRWRAARAERQIRAKLEEFYVQGAMAAIWLQAKNNPGFEEFGADKVRQMVEQSALRELLIRSNAGPTVH